jgi:hypothetical protein
MIDRYHPAVGWGEERAEPAAETRVADFDAVVFAELFGDDHGSQIFTLRASRAPTQP